MPANSFKYIPTAYNEMSAQEVLPFVISQFRPDSVLDVGCGLGTWLSVAQKLKISDVIGTDGHYVDSSRLYIPENLFIKNDLSKPFYLNREFDMAICLEVAEHIEEEYADVFIESLIRHSKLILFSAAVPGQFGERHVNEQPPAYWQKKFQKYGFHYYDMLRDRFWENKNVDWWYKQNMFIVAHKDIQLNFPICEEIHSYIHPQLYAERMRVLKLYVEEDLKFNIVKVARLLKTVLINKVKGRYRVKK